MGQHRPRIITEHFPQTNKDDILSGAINDNAPTALLDQPTLTTTTDDLQEMNENTEERITKKRKSLKDQQTT